MDSKKNRKKNLTRFRINLKKKPYIFKSSSKDWILFKTKKFHQKKGQNVPFKVVNNPAKKFADKKIQKVIAEKFLFHKWTAFRRKIKKRLQNKFGRKFSKTFHKAVQQKLGYRFWRKMYSNWTGKTPYLVEKIKKKEHHFSWLQHFRLSISKGRSFRARSKFFSFQNKRKNSIKINKKRQLFLKNLFFKPRRNTKLFLKKNRRFLLNSSDKKLKLVKSQVSTMKFRIGAKPISKKKILGSSFVKKAVFIKKKQKKRIILKQPIKSFQSWKRKKLTADKERFKRLKKFITFFKKKILKVKNRKYNKYKNKKNKRDKFSFTKKGRLYKRKLHRYRRCQLLRPVARQYRFQKRVLPEFNVLPAQKFPHMQTMKKRLDLLNLKKDRNRGNFVEKLDKMHFWWSRKNQENKQLFESNISTWNKIFRLTPFSFLRRKTYSLKKTSKKKLYLKKKNKLRILFRSFVKKKKLMQVALNSKPSIVGKNIKALVLIKRKKNALLSGNVNYLKPKFSPKNITSLPKTGVQNRFFSSLALKFVEEKKRKGVRRKRKKKKLKKLFRKLFLKKDVLFKKNRKLLRKNRFSAKNKISLENKLKIVSPKKKTMPSKLSFRALGYLKRRRKQFPLLFFKKYKKKFQKKISARFFGGRVSQLKSRKNLFWYRPPRRTYRRRGYRNWNYRLPRFRKYYRYLWKYNGTDQRNKWLRPELYSFRDYRKVHQIFRRKDPRQTKKNGWLRRLSFATKLHAPASRKDRLVSHLMHFKLFSKFYGPFTTKKLANWARHFQRIQPRIEHSKLMPLYWFDRRIDVTVFRLGLAPSLKVARVLVARGYIFVNGRQILNVEHRISTWDVVSITPYHWLEFQYHYYWLIRGQYKFHLYKKKKARLRSIHPQKLTYPFGFWTHQYQDIDLRNREQIPEKAFEKTLLCRYGKRWV